MAKYPIDSDQSDAGGLSDATQDADTVGQPFGGPADGTDGGERDDLDECDTGEMVAERLAGTVYVDGQAYGPDSDVPASVAAQITNPKAWADGKVPDLPPRGGQGAGRPGSAPGGGASDADATATRRGGRRPRRTGGE